MSPVVYMLFSIVALACAASAGATEPESRLFVLAPGPEGASTDAPTVSADGITVVGQLAYPHGRVEAFRWRPFEALEILGDLAGGLQFTTATAVREDGTVVAGTGHCADTSRPNDGVQVAWTYTTEGGFVELPDLTGGSVLANANGISWDGSVVVGGSGRRRA